MKRLMIFLTLMIGTGEKIHSQKAPIKMGDVDMADMTMTAYPADTSAPAVILCDYGFFNSNNLQFTRILRIKILKKEGYSWADQSYPLSSKSMIKGITYNLENGKIVQEKLKNESIFSVRVTEDNYNMRVAMPNVKEGSVIDIQFTFTGIPWVWRFQETIPVRYSELIIQDTPNIRFKTNYSGYEPLALSSQGRWIAKNMPSFKVEPFMDSEENYLTKLEFDIIDIQIGTYYQSVSSTWENIFKNLMLSDNFGKALTGSSFLNETVKQITATATTPIEKMKLAFEAVKREVKWDENESLVTSSPTLGYIYKTKSGNSADINLILFQMLKKLDIDVIPVALSTRDNGKISMFSPSSNKLNYVIIQAKIDNKKYLLDATEEYLPYNLLTYRCLNFKGCTVNEVQSEWVDLVTTSPDKRVTLYDVEIQPDLTLKGSLSVASFDYAALNMRKNYHKFNSQDEYLEDFKKDMPGLSITATAIDKLDSLYQPVTEKYDVSISEKVTSIGNEIYITPLFYHQMTENSFKADVRKYPIDFGYKVERTVLATIKIPDGYTVSTLPAPVILKLQGNTASYTYETISLGQVLRVTSRMVIAKTSFLPDEYLALRELYNQIIKKQAEPVILKKL